MNKILFFLLPAVVLLGQGCPVNSEPPEETREVTEKGCTPKNITVVSPLPNATESLPLHVEVMIENRKNPDCSWTLFEAQAGVAALFDGSGAEVGSVPLATSDEWMTDGPVTFEGVIQAEGGIAPGEATLVITEEDPSGEGDVQIIEIPFILQ